MTNLTHIEQELIDARDALIAYWEQSEGQACFAALQMVEDALAVYRAGTSEAERRDHPEAWQRIETLAEEVIKLRAPLAGKL